MNGARVPPGWACPCCTFGVSVPISFCPRRYVVRGTPAARAETADDIRNRPPLLHAVTAPVWLPLPRGVHKLCTDLWTAGVVNRLTYAVGWAAALVPIDARPVDADRLTGPEGDSRDVETVRVAGENTERQKGRKTRDVAVLLESLALRATHPGRPFGVACWTRRAEVDGGWRAWKADGSWLIRGGLIEKVTVTEFKNAVKEITK